MKPLLLISALTILSLPVMAQEVIHTMTITDAYAYPTSPSQKNGAAFLTITNTMPMPDKVIAVYGEVAQNIELHTHTMDGDVMQMREVKYFEVPGGGQSVLKPMGDHIMLMGLKEQLKEGEKFRLTIDFEKAPDQIINVHIGYPDE